MGAIERSMVGRTVIVVAHRLSTVRNAHCICVMKERVGIVESGTHDQLLSKNGEYAKFVAKQLVHAGLNDLQNDLNKVSLDENVSDCQTDNGVSEDSWEGIKK